MGLYLAIDAGGTKTTCLLADSDGNAILARASSGTVKLMRVPEEEATARLRTLLEEVAASAGISLRQITRTCLGLAGITTPAARAWALRTLPTLVSGELILCGDEEIALDAAFHGGPGILVIAGTGSNIVGRSASGQLVHAGGWGPVLGDEGSGYWIGLEAIRAALHALDREPDRIGLNGPSSRLLREIRQHWSLGSLAELVALANQRGDATHPAPDFASLAPIVALCAQPVADQQVTDKQVTDQPVADQRGDPLAARILERAGQELAEQVTLVFHKMAFSKMTAAVPTSALTEPAPIGIAYTGSVLSQIAPVRAAMSARLAVTIPTARILDAPVDPLDGALWRAGHP